MRRWRPLTVLLVLATALVACASPEATRTRGDGARSGADVGNWSAVIEMHEGSRPYWDTARLIEPFGMPDLGGARQAHRLSTGADGTRR